MNGLMYLLFVCLFSLDWLVFVLNIGGRALTWIPELLSIVAMVAVFVIVTRHRSFTMEFRYGLFLAAYLAVVVGWAVVSGVATGVILAGMRSYLKYLPFFLLPLVYGFSEKQIRRQLLFLAALSVLQLPVTVYQRFVQFAGLRTGDVIGGTLGLSTSGLLSIYLGCAIAVSVSFYVKEKIRLRTLIPLVTLLALPMMLNETKVSSLLIPAAVLGPLALSGKLRGNLQKSLALLIVGVAVGSAYLYMYETLRGTSVVDFFMNSEKVEHYVYRGDDPRLYDTLSRFDSIDLAVRQLGHEGNLLLGVGAGNASVSFSEKLTGEYYKKYSYLEPGMVYLSRVLWELGMVGVLLFIALFGLVARDAYRLRHQTGIIGPLGLAWVIISGFMAASFIYFKTFDLNLFGYLYWYFSGYIVAESYRMRERVRMSAENVESGLSSWRLDNEADRGRKCETG